MSAADIVFDSCVIAKLVLPEADSARATSVLHQTGARSGRVVALDLAYAEVTT
jgi:hypothetical protein